jgi:hypothetical protein
MGSATLDIWFDERREIQLSSDGAPTRVRLQASGMG